MKNAAGKWSPTFCRKLEWYNPWKSEHLFSYLPTTTWLSIIWTFKWTLTELFQLICHYHSITYSRKATVGSVVAHWQTVCSQKPDSYRCDTSSDQYLLLLGPLARHFTLPIWMWFVSDWSQGLCRHRLEATILTDCGKERSGDCNHFWPWKMTNVSLKGLFPHQKTYSE